jgi:hypothetical protein
LEKPVKLHLKTIIYWDRLFFCAVTGRYRGLNEACQKRKGAKPSALKGPSGPIKEIASLGK